MFSNRTSLKGTSILLLTALIWGIAFVAQRSAMSSIGPFLFQGMRMFLGTATLLLVFVISKGIKSIRSTKHQHDVTSAPLIKPYPTNAKKFLFLGAMCSGLVLFIAGSLQQVALVTTTASKAAFLTAMYIVLVPVLGLFIKHKTHWNTWVSVVIAVAGLYCLTIQDTFSIEMGDALTIVGALFWALHILSIDYFVSQLNEVENGVMKLCMGQFLVAGILSLVSAPIFDSFMAVQSFSFDSIVNSAPELLYVGILSTGIAFTTQAVGQKYTKPSTASLIMSLEAVFGAIGGVIILGESMSISETIGCILMFAAVMLTQIQFTPKKQIKSSTKP